MFGALTQSFINRREWYRKTRSEFEIGTRNSKPKHTSFPYDSVDVYKVLEGVSLAATFKSETWCSLNLINFEKSSFT